MKKMKRKSPYKLNTDTFYVAYIVGDTSHETRAKIWVYEPDPEDDLGDIAWKCMQCYHCPVLNVIPCAPSPEFEAKLELEA